MEQEMDKGIAAAPVVILALYCTIEERVEPKDKDLDFVVDVHLSPNL